MMYNIIEDNSPYYVKFNMPNAVEIANVYKDVCNRVFKRPFVSEPLHSDSALEVIKLFPEFNQLELLSSRMNIFVSKPGLYSPPHKDGSDMQFGINIPIEILDEHCITNWYTDSSVSEFEYYAGPDNFMGMKRYIRELRNYQVDSVKPTSSTTMKHNECLLFNVGAFHDWDNRRSPNRRIILTLRPVPHCKLSFDDVANILFGG